MTAAADLEAERRQAWEELDRLLREASHLKLRVDAARARHQSAIEACDRAAGPPRRRELPPLPAAPDGLLFTWPRAVPGADEVREAA